MVETIKNVTAIVEQDPSFQQAGRVDRERSPRKDGAPQRAPEATQRSSEPTLPVGVSVAKEVAKVVEDINALVHQVASTKITFDIDEETGRSVVRVLDKETGEVVRQVPPEELLALVARMRQLSGLIFSEEV
ncbi:MAG: flagellar protein FlaG [Candidatus Neomarinimicrobiota bacterium]